MTGDVGDTISDVLLWPKDKPEIATAAMTSICLSKIFSTIAHITVIGSYLFCGLLTTIVSRIEKLIKSSPIITGPE